MSVTITRRDLLKFAGGTALGLLFTPVPWKMLDDTAIWTQNWELIPKLPRGPISHRLSACTLCPAGCAPRARCVGGMPISLQGIAEHGAPHGVLCPVGLAGHHVATNPLRLSVPVAFSCREDQAVLSATTAGEVARRLAEAIRSREPGERVAILDCRPGRVVSGAYRRFLRGINEGEYLTTHTGDDLTAEHLGALLRRPPLAVGFDLAHADLILSAGVPLFDGWGTPECMAELLAAQRRSACTIIQVESCRSRTASQARCWLPTRPGSELSFALGLAHILLRDEGCARRLQSFASDARDFREFVSGFTPESTAEKTGLQIPEILETARMLRCAARPVVLAGCDPAGGPLPRDAGRMLSALNLLLGTPGTHGTVTIRQLLPDESDEPTRTLVDLPDHSVAALILDGAENGYVFPWAQVERKLIPERSLVVSLSPYFGGLAARADAIVPSPAHFEATEELGQNSGSPARCFGIAPLLPARPGSTRPTELLQLIQHELHQQGGESIEALLERRASAIHATGRGTLLAFSTGVRTQVAAMGWEEFWSTLSTGARWTDEVPAQPARGRVRMLDGIDRARLRVPSQSARSNPGECHVLFTGLRSALGAGSLAPVMSKVFQESELRSRTGVVILNGATARLHSLRTGDRIRLRSPEGSLVATLHIEETVADMVALLPVGPSPHIGQGIERSSEEESLRLCSLSNDGSWKTTTAWIEKV
jgi:hypothetical protein